MDRISEPPVIDSDTDIATAEPLNDAETPGALPPPIELTVATEPINAVTARPSRRLNRLGYAAAATIGIATVAAATTFGIDKVMKHRDEQAAERRAAAELRKVQAEETAKIDSTRATIEWDYKRAKRAVESWQAHKNGKEIMSPQQLEGCLWTMQVWMEKAETLHAHERNSGRPSGETMYYYLSIPEIKPSADELRGTLRHLTRADD